MISKGDVVFVPSNTRTLKNHPNNSVHNYERVDHSFIGYSLGIHRQHPEYIKVIDLSRTDFYLIFEPNVIKKEEVPNERS